MEAGRTRDIQAEISQLSEVNRQLKQQNAELISNIASLTTQEQTFNLAIKEIEQAKKEESLALNWELEDLRAQLAQTRKVAAAEVPQPKSQSNKDTQTHGAQTSEVSVEAIIINTSMVE